MASYDRTKNLVIDPVIDYSTYLGGTNLESGYGIAVDVTGAVYVAGQTWSTDFPTSSPLQAAINGTRDAFVTKINPAGSAIVYSTYFGGSGFEQANAIALDSTGAAYITGSTSSNLDFPVVNAIQGTYGGGINDAFITKINPSGSAIVYSTYLGGSTNRDEGFAIAVDSLNQAYVTGSTDSLDFPLVGAMQPTSNGASAFVTKVNATGSAFVFSTYLGGSSSDQGFAIAVDPFLDIYVGGQTLSDDFPTTLNAFQTSRSGTLWQDAFISKIDPNGSSFLYSTYLGGTNFELLRALVVDSTGAVYATGETRSDDFPTVNPIQPLHGGFIPNPNAFVTKVNPAGSALVYSTYLGGGANYSRGMAIAVNSAGEAYVYGTNSAVDFPVVNPIPGMVFVNGGTPFLTKVDAGGTQWLFSTPIGSSALGSGLGLDIAMDTKGTVYLTGQTFVMDFPTVNPIQPVFGGTSDAFVTHISDAALPVVTIAAVPDGTSIGLGSSLGYTVTAVDRDAATQCFDYWEDVTLPGGGTYPTGSALFGPVNVCLNAGTSQTAHLTHSVPISAPTGNYVFNSYVGAYISPSFKLVVDEGHFGFNIFMPASPAGGAASWSLIENGFVK